MKKIKALAIVALALAAVIFAVMYGVKLINVIILNWSAIVVWLSAASIKTAACCAGLLLSGYFLTLVVDSDYRQRGFARLIQKFTRATLRYIEGAKISRETIDNIGTTMIVVSIIMLFANTFTLFLHFGLLRLWLIILGGVGIVALDFLIFKRVIDTCESNFWAWVILIACILGFTYYLDVFIFSWNRPCITEVAALVLIILCAIISVSKAKEARNDVIRKAEYEARTANEEAERLQAKTFAKQALQDRLRDLSFYDLVISYFNENKQNEHIHWNDIVSFYVEAMRNIVEHDTGKLEANAEQKIHIAWLMSKKDAERSSKFYKVIASVFSTTDIEAVLFSNVDGSTERVMPEAFTQCQCKKEVVANFLSEEFGDKYRKMLHNRIKREFAADEFYGLINALIYSYQKTWDEDLSAKVLARIAEIFTFANDTIDSLWQKGNREQLRKQLDRVYSFCLLNGIHVHLPAIKQESVEEPKA